MCCELSPGSRLRSVRTLAPTAGAALVGLFAAACGDAQYSLGGSGSVSDLSTAPHVGRCDPHAAVDMIDDMEDADGSIFLRHDRAGVWFSYNDDTNKGADGQQWPKAGAERFFMDPVSPARAGTSAHAAHTYGSGYTNWGAGIGFDLLVQQAYDASKYSGLTFWLRRAPGAASFVRLNVTDRNSSPLGNVCDSESGHCYSDFGYDLTATEDWQEIKLQWSELTQPFWTAASDVHPAIVTSALFGIRFQADKSQDFDFSVDDIAFLCPN